MKPPPSAAFRRRRRLFFGAVMLALAAAASAVALWRNDRTKLTKLASRLHAQQLDDSKMPSRAMVRRLRERGTLVLAPPAPNVQAAGPDRWPLPVVARRGGGQGTLDKCAPFQLAAGPVGRAWSATPLLSPEVRALAERGVPIVSIALDPCRLERLYRNPLGRGREWEEPAAVVVLLPDQPAWYGGVGLRLHGGRSRTRYRKGFRLHARKKLGAESLPATWLGATGPELQSIVLRNEVDRDYAGRDWYFTAPMVYELGRQIGGLAPATRPVLLVLNGNLLGPHALTERVDEVFAGTRLGSSSVETLRTKGELEENEQAALAEGLQWLRSVPRIDRASASRLADLEQLRRWLATTVFVGTSDQFQAPMIRDLTADPPVWKIAFWDVDLSFFSLRTPIEESRRNVLRRSFVGAAGANVFSRYLLYRLFSDDPQFGAEFARTTVDAMNHEWRPELTLAMADRYERVAVLTGGDSPDSWPLLHAFFRDRQTEVLGQLAEFLRLPPAVELRLLASAGESPLENSQSEDSRRDAGITAVSSSNAAKLAVRVDDHLVTLPWNGWYFAGMEVAIEVKAASETAADIEVFAESGTSRLRLTHKAQRLRVGANGLLMSGGS